MYNIIVLLVCNDLKVIKKMRVFIRRIALSFVIFSINIPVFSQLFDLQPPLDIPLFLSGNFGELRSTHFHAGIDIKTQGEIGKKVFAVADGYISRVKIQTGGYGHSVYIKHANGYTSVYAHLDKFFPALDEYVKGQQYAQKKFEVDIFPNQTEFPVKSRQFIGVSGNTGSSGGPHLHLEIRDKNDIPLNVLQFGLPIKDTIPPVFKNLVVYHSVDPKTFQHSRKEIIAVSSNKWDYKIDKPIKISDVSAFGVEIYDFLNGSNNKCGIYTLDFFIDEQLFFSVTIDKISFNEASFIKTYTDYEEKLLNGSGIHRMFIETNNKLSIYNNLFNNGLYYLNDSLMHNAKITATDVYGNKAELKFKMVHNTSTQNLVENGSNEIYLYCDRENTIADSNFVYKVPVGALYSDKSINYYRKTAGNQNYFDIICLGREVFPMHRYPSLSIKPLKISPNKSDKLVIVRIDTTGKIISEGGNWSNGWVTANVKGFGNYSVMCDSLAPTIYPTAFREYSRYKNGSVFSFKIEDELSGIKSYNGYIDDEWVLFEYEPKSDSLFYKIDPVRLEKKQDPHTLKIIVTDERSNSGVFTGKFYY